METLSTRGKLAAGFGAIMCVFVITSMLTFYQFKKNEEAAGWTVHTYEVIDLTEKLLIALINIETGQRGFLLAGQDNFLAPLKQGELYFDKALSEIG
jgi:methyl-accepting chemotaxis protein